MKRRKPIFTQPFAIYLLGIALLFCLFLFRVAAVTLLRKDTPYSAATEFVTKRLAEGAFGYDRDDSPPSVEFLPEKPDSATYYPAGSRAFPVTPHYWVHGILHLTFATRIERIRSCVGLPGGGPSITQPWEAAVCRNADGTLTVHRANIYGMGLMPR